jgi:hypothetical protein
LDVHEATEIAPPAAAPEAEPDPKAGEIAVLRPGEPSDHPFIVDSWLQSYRGQSIARDAGHRYMHDMKWLVRAWLARCAVIVACDPEAPGAIWGWAVTTGDMVLYAYVRMEFRRQGIAKMMLHPFLVPGRRVTFASKTQERIRLPHSWDYSFLAAVRLLTE